MRISDVQRKDIAKLHFDLREKPYQANRTLGVLSKMFSLAEVWGLRPDGSNPCRHVKRYKEHKRERFLSPEETERLGEVLREAEVEMPSAVAAFRLLLLTGCRLSEVQFLRWEYVKGDWIELPDAKTGGRVVPLGPEARSVIANLPREDDNPWVIAGRVPPTSQAGPEAAGTSTVTVSRPANPTMSARLAVIDSTRRAARASRMSRIRRKAVSMSTRCISAIPPGPQPTNRRRWLGGVALSRSTKSGRNQ